MTLYELIQAIQPELASLEKGKDVYVSRLKKVIEAMGGELYIMARFPHGEVKINFSELIDQPLKG